MIAGLVAGAPEDARACGGSGGAAPRQIAAADDLPVVAPRSIAVDPGGDDGPVTAGAMSALAREALDLFEQKRWIEAAIALDRAARGEGGDDAGNQKIARYHLAIALARLELPQPSFDLFTAIAEDRSHPRHREALPWLVTLLPEVADVNDVVDHLDAVRAEDAKGITDPSARGEMAYLLGRRAFRRRNYEDAVALFDEVPAGSKRQTEALIFAGTAEALLQRRVQAVKRFKAVVDALDHGAPDLEGSPGARALAHLGIARVYYTGSVHLDEPCTPTTDGAKLSAAARYWGEVAADGDLGATLDSLFEQSWVYFMVGDYSHALGNLHTLKAPYFPQDRYPEADILQALVAFTTCRYEDAETLVARMEKTYRPMQRSLEAATAALGAEGGEDRLWIALFRARATGADPPADLRPAVEMAIEDRPVLRRIAHARKLEAQAARIAALPATFRTSPVGISAFEAIKTAELLDVQAAAARAQRLLKRRIADLDERLRDAMRLRFDILVAQRDLLMASIGGATSLAPRDPPPTQAIFRDHEHVVWPFDGEYWKDELGSYRQIVVSRCR